MSGNNKCNIINKNDARTLTDYRPSETIVNLIMKQNNIDNSYDLKHLLVHNGSAFRKLNTAFYTNETSNCDTNGQLVMPDPFKYDKMNNSYKNSLKK